MKYEHTADMGEISGFGGSYEQACQDMLNAGVVWLNKNTNADLQAKTYANVFGILEPTSDDAKALSDAIEAAVDDCAGAMHQAVMSRLFFIAKSGWDAYCSELRKAHAGGAA